MPQYSIKVQIEFGYEGEFESEEAAEKFASNYDNLMYEGVYSMEIEELEEDYSPWDDADEIEEEED